MGVPAFYRWLSQRYPKIVVDCVEEQAEMVGTVEIPVDITLSNPNGVEFNNLYLDMNGIIHPCFHPEDRAPPTTEAEVFSNIFEYIDRLVAIARPRTLIYLAIDGVAPRAKMNQQRSRRFRAAQDREEQKEIEAKLRADFARQGIHVAEKAEGETFDSNVITPGTEFMDRLAIALQWYVHERLNSEPGWRDLTVVLSDANTPGEGEHKFMQFVREQRGRPGWNANTWHCVYGLDADLIHLALASHEPHFYILREVVFQEKRGGARGGGPRDGAPGAAMDAVPEAKPLVARKPYQFLKIDVLREYLAVEFADLRLPFEFDAERVIDDFVFMCFFVGNDFLPHMPTLDIREEGIELMLHVYREQLPRLPGYLASGAHLHLERVEQFIQAVGGYEDKIFQARSRKLNADKRRHSVRKAEEGARRAREGPPRRHSAPSAVPPLAGSHGDEDKALPPPPVKSKPEASSNAAAASELRQRLQKRQRAASEVGALPENGDAAATTDGPATDAVDADDAPEKAEEVKAEDAEAEEPESKRQKLTSTAESDAAYKGELKDILKSKTDNFEAMVSGEEDVRLGEDGWKARYYEQKFGLSDPEDQAALVADLRRCYVEGLCWVMRYYFDGVASWRWFYPYHYAPFASDLTAISQLKIEFELGEPFQPFNQLMGVLPAGSKHALPEPLRPLFDTEESPILDFYPSEFKIDMNGKRFAWQGVALLPFIEEDRLLDATGPIIGELPPDERRRNEKRLSMILARADSAAGSAILEQATRVKSEKVPDDKLSEHAVALPTEKTVVSGQLVPCRGDACPPTVSVPPFARSIGKPIENNRVALAMFEDPPHQAHSCRIMPGTQLRPPSLTALDAPKQGTLWCMQHEARMAQRDRGVHPPGERRDFRYNQVGQAPMPQRPQHMQRRPGPGIMPGGPPPQQAYYSGAPYGQGAMMQPQQVQMQQQQFVPQQQMYQQAPQIIYAQPGAVQGGYVVQQGMQVAGAQPMVIMAGGAAVPVMAPGMPPGQGGSFFANMRPAPAQGPGAPGAYQSGSGQPGVGQHSYGGGGYGSRSHRGGGGRHAPPPDGRGNQFQAFRDERR